MGFFSDLKEDLSQAVNELLPEAVEEEKVPVKTISPEPEAKAETVDLDELNLSDMLDKLDQMGSEFDLEQLAKDKQEEVVPEEPMDVLKEAEAILAEETETVEDIAADTETQEVTEAEETSNVADASETESFDEDAKAELERLLEETDLDALMKEAEETLDTEVEEVKAEVTATVPVEETITETKEEPYKEDKKEMYEEEQKQVKRVATDEVAVITEGMTIRGDVETEGSLDLIGKVIGNIDICGKLNITGTVEGNSSAAEIYAERAHIIGELKSDGALKIGQSSVIIGDVFGNSAVVAGAIKGDIDVKGPVILDSTAIVMGNIKSKSVQINNGAVIEGMCSQCYADVSPTTFFSELKNM